jgi:predicted transcriptional regulator
MQGLSMKTAALPAVRVSPELRQAAEEVLQSGETLSGFVEDAVRRNVEFRQAQKAFVDRGLASSEAARKSGKYVAAATVLGKLARRLDKAHKGRTRRTGAKPAA